jgi:predicted nucleic-acid-binding protein
MIGIDTNILVRYLTEDDIDQADLANKLISRYVNCERSIFINNIVICELIWVLERGYKYRKEQIVALIKEILSTIEFNFENHEILWLTLKVYEKSSADFSDISIGKTNAYLGCHTTYSFDSKAYSLEEFNLL